MDQLKRVCLAFSRVFGRNSLTRSLLSRTPVRLERDLYGSSIAFVIHSLDYYYEPNDGLNSYTISIY